MPARLFPKATCTWKRKGEGIRLGLWLHHTTRTPPPGLAIADGGPKFHVLQGKSTAANALKDTKAPDKQGHWICNYVRKKCGTWAMTVLGKGRVPSSFPTDPPSLLSAQLVDNGEKVVLKPLNIENSPAFSAHNSQILKEFKL